ncbi:hypothetical protein BZA05DRAFT_474547 [Tricharina praecox]|uniref:uncharacterized protein n=1 Tax=Tricharina praecox TaxID=43433 RepID=UPI0022200C96|nr:uncharacterized protein BZA05DRAFT_474547 [Tricharina praecox]KAI5849952.1 hypothetical protein BZA05DRAFT_474547 [Tricharina praecox]
MHSTSDPPCQCIHHPFRLLCAFPIYIHARILAKPPRHPLPQPHPMPPPPPPPPAPPPATAISDYPFLTAAEFRAVCGDFVRTQEWLAKKGYRYDVGEWVLRERGAGFGERVDTFLQLRRYLPAPVAAAAGSLVGVEDGEPDEEAELEEDDSESLPSTALRARPQQVAVLYNILYSPNYRVPVLYFTPPASTSAAALEELGFAAGAVGQGEHLLTGEAWCDA